MDARVLDAQTRFALLPARDERSVPPMKFFSFWRSLASFRVRIALNLKNVPAEIVFVDLDANAHRADDYRRINPQMALPARVENDGTVLFQSLAILEYLEEKHPEPPLLPADPLGRARVRALALMVACEGHPLLAAGAAVSRSRAQSARHPAGGVAAALDSRDAGRAGGPSRRPQGYRPILPWRSADFCRYLHGRPCLDRAHAADQAFALANGQAHPRDRDRAAGVRKSPSAGAARYARGDAAEGDLTRSAAIAPLATSSLLAPDDARLVSDLIVKQRRGRANTFSRRESPELCVWLTLLK
jgi:glutathione S-transferase